ncbi:hypothetical protein GCM10027294_47870 [Marinactinospora endophytica]
MTCLEPNCAGASCAPSERYKCHVAIGANTGTSAADQIALSVQRADNNCPGVTESWCVGLQLNDDSVAAGLATDNDANLTPLCIGATLDRSKPANSGADEFMYGVPGSWATGNSSIRPRQMGGSG